MKSNNACLWSILLLALVLRLYGLENRALWTDESYSVSFTFYPITDLFYHRYLNRPIYFVFLKLWSIFFGTGEFFLRLPSVLFGVISVWAIYKLGRLIFNKKVALWAAFLLALSPFHIYWSQEVRNYTFVIFLAIINMFYFIRLLKFDRKRDYIAYTFVTIILIYSHPMTLYLIPVQHIFAFFSLSRKRLKKWLKWWAIIFIFLAVLIGICLATVGSHTFIRFNQRLTPSYLFPVIETFNYGGPIQAHGQDGFVIVNKKLIVPRILNVLFAVIFIIALKPLYFKKIKDIKGGVNSIRGRLFFLLLWLLIPVIIPYLSSVFYVSFYLLRHTIISLPAYYLIIAYGVSLLRSKRLMILIVCIIMFLMSFALYNYYNLSKNRLSWREIGLYLRKNIKPADAVIFIPTDQMPAFFYYFNYNEQDSLKNIDVTGKVINKRSVKEFKINNNLFIGVDLFKVKDFINRDKALPIVNQNRNVWLIMSPDWPGVFSESFYSYLNKYYNLIYSMYASYNGAELRCYKIKN